MSGELGKTTQSKQRMRRRLADLPYGQKLQILDELREDQSVRLTETQSSAAPAQIQERPKSLLEYVKHTVERCPRDGGGVADGCDERFLTAEVEALFSDRARAVQTLSALFPEGVPANSAFYDRLTDLQLRLGWRDLSHRTVGRLLSVAIEQLGIDAGETLLLQLPSVRSPDFFQLLDALCVVTEEQTLRPEFAASWFPTLVRRIGNDLASGGFWKALVMYCEKHPESSIEVLRFLLGAREDEEIAVAANVLGTLRTLSLSKAASAELTHLDATFCGSSVALTRSVHHRSWIQTAWRGKLTKEHLIQLLDRMSRGTPDEVELAFWVVSRLLISTAISSDVFDCGKEWLQNNAKPAISAVAKHHLMDFAAHLAHQGRWEGEGLVLSIQPIPVESKGTWQRLEAFLVSRLQKDLAAFSAFCLKLAERNAGGWLEVMQEQGSFEWLIAEMQGKCLGELVGRLVYSRNGACRKLGLFLFEELSLVSLPNEIIDHTREDDLRLAFCESQRTLALHGESIARFLIVLLPIAQRASQEFQNEFYNELVLQAKNFGGSCRDEFKKHADEFPFLKRALEAAESYSEALGKVRTSSISAMQVSGYRQASRISGRRFASVISRGAEQASVFLKLFKKVRLLYGKEWSSFHNGKLGSTSGLQQISTQMEIPRLEEIDPEGMALRRIHAAVQIRDISSELETDSESE